MKLLLIRHLDIIVYRYTIRKCVELYFFISSEEAQKMWQIQEKRWAIEQEARNNLMRDVLSTIQLQVIIFICSII